MRYLILALAMLALPASADVMVATGSGTNSLRLYGTPCTHAATLERIGNEEWRPFFRMAQADMGGRTLSGCWIDLDDFDAIFVLIDGADGFALSVEAFKLERGI